MKQNKPWSLMNHVGRGNIDLDSVGNRVLDKEDGMVKNGFYENQIWWWYARWLDFRNSKCRGFCKHSVGEFFRARTRVKAWRIWRKSQAVEKLLGFDDSLNNRNERPQSLLWLPYFVTVVQCFQQQKWGNWGRDC